MKPEQMSQTFLAITRSKAKMIEYNVPEEYRDINFNGDTERLFPLSIGLLGDLAANINGEESSIINAQDLQNHIIFSAHFFDSYFQTRLNKELDDYLILLGSSSYYLCDYPGSSKVLAYKVESNTFSNNGECLENLLLWLLRGNIPSEPLNNVGVFIDDVNKIKKMVQQFFSTGEEGEGLLLFAEQFRDKIYNSGNSTYLLLGDLILAIIKKKYNNSSWIKIPEYSGIDISKWLEVLLKDSFIKELWPAQHLLGEAGVFKGKSAVVQMPTSAGKTKASELVIRSAFIAERTSLVVIVAPFRALCHEIKNSLATSFLGESIKVDELTDVFQTDFDLEELLENKQILVVTPEKLLYVLRHNPELGNKIGLIIFDEGHQFDSGTRGITYELLITSLRSLLPEYSQTILISAVISNADVIGSWLIGDDSQVVSGINLNPTFRTIGFASWVDSLGQIKFITDNESGIDSFFVPRVIEQHTLQKKPRESKLRVFPDKTDGQSIALYLGLKLVPNGSVAIFCGRKTTVTSICENAVEIYERNISIDPPAIISNQKEMNRIYNLYKNNFGVNETATKSAKLGIFTHHGDTPHGIRLAVEYAMRENLIHFVVCTSTLAQGVNLPIRYLIVNSVYQGLERIKVRDFHNLMGRAGRADQHTEGSILFADSNIYDKKNSKDEDWRWDQAKELLDPNKSEPCISNLLSLFHPLRSDNGKNTLDINIKYLIHLYNNNPEQIDIELENILNEHKGKQFTFKGLRKQIDWKISLLSSVESFLISNWDTDDTSINEEGIEDLAKSTLAYFIADDKDKNSIVSLFRYLANNVTEKVPNRELRKVYGRTLYGITEAQDVEIWVRTHIDEFVSSEDLLDLIWDLMIKKIHTKSFQTCNKPEILKPLVSSWLSGNSYCEIYKIITESDAKKGLGLKPRKYKIEDVVDMFEMGIAYDGILLIGAVVEFIQFIDNDDKDIIVGKMQLFQKKLKYGLPSDLSIIVYELGFVDRVIAQELAKNLSCSAYRKDVINALKSNAAFFESLIEKYPTYYHVVLDRYIGNQVSKTAE